VLLGALAMTATAWWRKIRLLRQHPAVPFSTKMTTYFVLSTVINFGFAAAGYLLGALLRLWLSG
jgi:hypothetical protein